MKIKEIKIREDDGSYSDAIPIGVDFVNVDTTNGSNLKIDLDNINKDLDNINKDLDNLQNKDIDLQNKDINLQNQINRLASGSPLVVNSVDEMTDTSRIYVNTSNGHWYWYNGSSWQDGGVYQAAEDSQTVNYLSKTVNRIDNAISKYNNANGKFIFGHINAEGGIESNNHKNITFEKPVFARKGSTIKVDEGYKYQLGLYSNSNDNSFVKRVRWLDNNTTYILDDDYYVRIEISYSDERVLTDYSITEHIKANLISEYISFVDGKNILLNYPLGSTIDLTPKNLDAYSYAIVECEQNDVFMINAQGGNNPRVWGFIDANNKLLSLADSSTTGAIQRGLKIIAPKNASRLIINDMYKNGQCYSLNRIYSNRYVLNELCSKIENIENDVANVKTEIENIENDVEYSLEQSNNIINAIGIDMFKNKTIEVTQPNKYKAWPFIESVNDKLVCLYSKGNAHEDSTGFDVLYRTSKNGVIWSKEKTLFDTPNVRENITGKGKDQNGNMLIWLRTGNPGASDTIHELYKTSDGENFTKVSSPIFSVVCGHIGDILSIPNTNTLISFFNTYGTNRSWGIVKSTDNGLTWTQRVIETTTEASQCPVEMSGTYLKDGKIIVMGRKDINGGTNTMFQIQSSDYGETWTKQYTNISDIGMSTPSIILGSNGMLSLYYFERGAGNLRLRKNNYNDVWNNPTNWSDSEIIARGTTNAQDTGNVNACAFKDYQIATFYSGDENNCGIYSVIQ